VDKASSCRLPLDHRALPRRRAGRVWPASRSAQRVFAVISSSPFDATGLRVHRFGPWKCSPRDLRCLTSRKRALSRAKISSNSVRRREQDLRSRLRDYSCGALGIVQQQLAACLEVIESLLPPSRLLLPSSRRIAKRPCAAVQSATRPALYFTRFGSRPRDSPAFATPWWVCQIW